MIPPWLLVTAAVSCFVVGLVIGLLAAWASIGREVAALRAETTARINGLQVLIEQTRRD